MSVLWTYIHLLIVNIMLVRSSISISAAKSQLEEMFPESLIPEGMPEWLAMLDDSIDILSCLPTIKDGRCYKSRTCRLAQVKFDGKSVPFTLKVCKDPYQIIIYFHYDDTRWYEEVDMKPFVINFNHDKDVGTLSVKSSTSIKKKIKWIGYGTRVFTLIINGEVRYDCTKPSGAENWETRVKYNLKSPSKAYSSSLWYKFKIRIEIKKKRFNWFKFDYHCVRCEDVVNESGTIGIGHRSCAADMKLHWEKEKKEIEDMMDYVCNAPLIEDFLDEWILCGKLHDAWDEMDKLQNLNI